MPDSFDPYQQWLEISDPTRPLDHYVLLGLNRQENDPVVIAHAADAVMAKLRKIRPGGRLADWGRLLDQLSGAKVCLLDPSSKAAYDASLPADTPQQPAPQEPAPQETARLAQGPQQPAVPTGMENRTAPDPMAPPGADPQSPAQADVTTQTPSGPAAPQGWSSAPQTLGTPTQGDFDSGRSMGTQPNGGDQVPMGGPMPVGGHIPQAEPAKPRISTALSAVMLLLAGSLAVYALWKFRQPQPVVQTPAEQNVEQNVDDDSPAPVDSDTPENPKPPQKPPEEPPSTPQQPQPPDVPANPPPENPPPNLDPPPRSNPPTLQIDLQKQATFTKEASQVRAAMSGRNVEAAQRHLEVARKNAQTPEETARVARLQRMLDYLNQFWDGMSQSVASLEAAQELAVMKTRVVVVESSRQHLIIRAAGKNRRYAIEDIPTVLVLSIVQDCFPDEPWAKALIGTFLTVDPDGDRTRARQYWQQATQGGIDVEQLMPELE